MDALRCIALLGPGLDGQLAIELLRRLGVDVIAATLSSPFTKYHDSVVASAARLNVPLIVLTTDEDYLQRVAHPRFGYTREMAPCLDCKVAMLSAAREKLTEHEASFLVTGDVLGQRLPGQSKRDFALVDFHAGVEGRVVRPLSGRMLPPVAGIDPAQLLNINGRGRQRQLALARSFGWSAAAAVTSGCLLADAAYARKLRDALQHPGNDERVLPLLDMGRYFRLSEECVVIVGRNAAENEALRVWYERHAAGAALLEPQNFVGPIAVVLGVASEAELSSAAQLVVHYGRRRETDDHDLLLSTPGQSPVIMRARSGGSVVPAPI
jgi:tRNA-specific 2-thiouridylase